MATILNSKTFKRHIGDLELTYKQTTELRAMEVKHRAIASRGLVRLATFCALGIEDLDNTYDRFLQYNNLKKYAKEILGDHYYEIYAADISEKTKVGRRNGRTLVEDIMHTNPAYTNAGLSYDKLNENQLRQLKEIFEKYDRNDIPGWHYAISNFLIYNLRNCVKRLDWLLNSGSSGSKKDYIYRYGSIEGNKRYAADSLSRSSGLRNTVMYWTLRGYTRKAAAERIREHNIKAANTVVDNDLTQLGNYADSLNWWIKRGMAREKATSKIRRIHDSWSALTLEERISKMNGWLSTIGADIETPNAIRRLKCKGSPESYLVRGITDDIREAEEIIREDGYREGRYSNISQDLFFNIRNKVPGEIWYAKDGKGEYKVGSQYVDFYDPESKIVIEFYGDYWHMNPEIYSKDSYAKSRIATDIWISDKQRIRVLEQSPDVSRVIIVWEKEYKDDKIGTIEKLATEILNERIKTNGNRN